MPLPFRSEPEHQVGAGNLRLGPGDTDGLDFVATLGTQAVRPATRPKTAR